jgi:hypothetical protein
LGGIWKLAVLVREEGGKVIGKIEIVVKNRGREIKEPK